MTHAVTMIWIFGDFTLDSNDELAYEISEQTAIAKKTISDRIINHVRMYKHFIWLITAQDWLQFEEFELEKYFVPEFEKWTHS